MVERMTSWIDMPFFSRMYESMKCWTVPGPSTLIVLPFSSFSDWMLLRTARPSPPFDLSISATCTVGMPAEVQTMCWSTVVAAALSAPEASAADRCTSEIRELEGLEACPTAHPQDHLLLRLRATGDAGGNDQRKPFHVMPPLERMRHYDASHDARDQVPPRYPVGRPQLAHRS